MEWLGMELYDFMMSCNPLWSLYSTSMGLCSLYSVHNLVLKLCPPKRPMFSCSREAACSGPLNERI